jgi:hypothetical protein
LARLALPAIGPGATVAARTTVALATIVLRTTSAALPPILAGAAVAAGAPVTT